MYSLCLCSNNPEVHTCTQLPNMHGSVTKCFVFLCVQDFDLCEPCYERHGHKHQMKKVGVGLVEIEHSGDEVDQREFVNRAFQRTIEVLVHATQCKDRNCKNRSCMKMKQVIFHVRCCRTCPIRNQFLQLCLQHAKQGKNKECAVPLCANLKKRIEERQRESPINQNRLMQRRMRVMRSDSSPSITPSNTVAQSPALVTPHPQPNTPTPKAPSKNSPTPLPAIRNPGSVPASISQPSPGGGKTLNPTQEPMHGPQSVPGKLISNSSPHPVRPATVNYSPLPGRAVMSDFIAYRKNPDLILRSITHHHPHPSPVTSSLANNSGHYASQGYPTQHVPTQPMPHNIYQHNQTGYPGNPPTGRMMYQDRMQYANPRQNYLTTSRPMYGMQTTGQPTPMDMGGTAGIQPHHARQSMPMAGGAGPMSGNSYQPQVHHHHHQQLAMQQHPHTQQRQMGMQTIHCYPPPHQAPGGRYPQYNQGPGTIHHNRNHSMATPRSIRDTQTLYRPTTPASPEEMF